jgi:RND family efflux transporter MFP subunit
MILSKAVGFNVGAAFLTGGLVLLTSGCTKKTQGQPSPGPASVSVVTVKQQNVPVFGEWVATLDGYINAQIQPQVSGYLIKQDYREGSLVHKGDVLYEIDPRPFQAVLDQAQGQLAQAKAQLGLAQINVKRDTPLAKERAIPQSQLDNDIQTEAQDEALVKTDEASVEQASLNLGFTKVRSLVDGIAGLAQTQVGSLVSTSTVLTAVSQVSPVKVYFPISEQEYLHIADKIKPGAVGDLLSSSSGVDLELHLADGSVYPHKGRIIFADRQVDAQTGTIRIVGAFPNPGNILRPGQFGRVRALTAINQNAILIPQRAVSEVQGKYQVAVVKPDNKVSLQSVQLGSRVDSMWVVQSGLHEGDRVITEGNAKVGEGSIVSPAPDTTPDGGN